MTPKEFIKLLEPHAKAVQARFYLPWQFMVAQAALETGWLRFPIKDSETGKDSHNLFGIKWTGPNDGAYVTCITHEYENGKRTQVEAKFRAYKTYTEGLADWAQFLMRNQRYKKALSHVKDPIQFAIEIAAAGYATDPAYADKVIQIMHRHLGV